MVGVLLVWGQLKIRPSRPSNFIFSQFSLLRFLVDKEEFKGGFLLGAFLLVLVLEEVLGVLGSEPRKTGWNNNASIAVLTTALSFEREGIVSIALEEFVAQTAGVLRDKEFVVHHLGNINSGHGGSVNLGAIKIRPSRPSIFIFGQFSLLRFSLSPYSKRLSVKNHAVEQLCVIAYS
jgi:hypothetical protein